MTGTKTRLTVVLALLAPLVVAACRSGAAPTATPLPPTTPAQDMRAVASSIEAEVEPIDRFSDEAGTMHRRSNVSSLPGPNQPVDFDELFLNKGLGPDGSHVEYYDFDVMPLASAPVFSVVYRSDPNTRVPGQRSIFGVIPGDEGYNDFWQITRVLVPDDYVANTLRSVEDIEGSGYTVEPTSGIINCPLVPLGSTARLADDIQLGWYEGKLVQYFSFEFTRLSSLPSGPAPVPYAVIRVMFNNNDPSHGFALERNSDQTHNVVDSVPGDELYRALWRVEPIDVAGFDRVRDWASTADVEKVPGEWPLVNCPVVVYPGSGG